MTHKCRLVMKAINEALLNGRNLTEASSMYLWFFTVQWNATRNKTKHCIQKQIIFSHICLLVNFNAGDKLH